MRKKISISLVLVVVAGFLGYLGYRFLPQILADEAYPLNYVSEINECADAFGLDKPLLAALILKESGFNPNATSHAGAMGLTQVMPGTWRSNWNKMPEIQGKVINDPYDPKSSICVGAGILAGAMANYDGDWTAALISYNGGDGAARRYLAAKSSAVLVTETRLYAPKILAARDVYAAMYGDQFTGAIGASQAGGFETGGGTSASVFVRTPTPAVSMPVLKPSDQSREFWKGFAKDVFARFFNK